MDAPRALFDRVDRAIIRFLAAYGITILRVSLAIVFLWFGALKMIGRSPVYDLVASTVYWFPARYVVPAIGAWEVLIGIGLLFRVFLRIVLLLFVVQMAGTFLVLVIHPGLAFQGGNPLLLTTEGEFVIKNLVLISAGLVIGSTVRRRVAEGPAVVPGESEKASTPGAREAGAA